MGPGNSEDFVCSQYYLHVAYEDIALGVMCELVEILI